MAQTRIRGPHTTPRTAVVWEVLSAEIARHDGRSLTVVDVGGGTGGFAVPLAEAGHRVTVVDASPDALAALTRRAADAGVRTGSARCRVTGTGSPAWSRPVVPTWCSATACWRWSTNRPRWCGRSPPHCGPAAPRACWSPTGPRRC